MKTPMLMCVKRLKKINHDHLNMQRHRVHSQNMGSWICGFEDGQLFSKVCAFYEGEGHAIMDCPFVHFHIRAHIARHVEL